MPAMGAKQTKVQKAFLGLKKPYDPTEIYIEMCKLLGLKEDTIERGLGKLFREGKLKLPQQDRPRRKKRREGGASGGNGDGF